MAHSRVISCWENLLNYMGQGSFTIDGEIHQGYWLNWKCEQMASQQQADNTKRSFQESLPTAISFFVCRFPQLYFPNISLPLCQFCLLNNDVQVNNNELSKEGCGESSLLVVAHFLRASISAMPDFKPPTLYPWKQSWGEKHSSVSLC